MAISRKNGPSTLVFSRQGLAPQPRNAAQLAQVEKGGYVLSDCDGTPEAIIIATGSEVELAMAAQEKLAGKKVRVVSMPCAEAFMEQDESYRESVLPSAVRARVAVEASHQDYWYKFVGFDGAIIGMSSFGESAPGGELMRHFGFTVENVVETVEKVLN